MATQSKIPVSPGDIKNLILDLLAGMKKKKVITTTIILIIGFLIHVRNIKSNT